MDERNFQFGSFYSQGIYKDIKKSMITLARYKFAMKMLEYENKLKVLEFGCSEGLGAYFFMQMPHCEKYVGVDMDQKAIRWCRERVKPDAENIVQGGKQRIS